MVLIHLAQIKEDRKLTMIEIAEMSGCTERTIARAIKGKGINRNTGKRIANGLKLPLTKLTGITA